MTTTAVSYIGSDSWNIEVYGLVSFASKLSGAVRDRRVAAQLTFCLWRVNSKLDAMFHHIWNHITTAQDVARGVRPPVSNAPVDPESIHIAIQSLEALSTVLERIIGGIKPLNDRLFKSGIARMEEHHERVVELKEWIVDLMAVDQLEAIFSDAKAEFDRGETVTLAD